jgi:hypothetical protein
LGYLGPVVVMFRKWREFLQSATRPLVPVRTRRGGHETSTSHSATRSHRSLGYACARIAHSPVDLKFSSTETTVSKRKHGGLMHHIIVCCMAGVWFRVGTRSRKYWKRARFAVCGARALLLRAAVDVEHRNLAVRNHWVAHSGGVVLLGVTVQKTREFLESAKRSLISAGECQNEHAACM